MEFGLDENGNRIRPAISGQRAKCPLCDGVLISKCGEIYIKHWQHKSNKDCDSWWEHETQWHRDWKNKFPDDWKEVIIERDGEKHIADIKTKNRTIIEFQNSSISSSTIRTRENFYGDMIWVINAITFKNNFEISSEVSTHLRNNEYDAEYRLSRLSNLYSEEIQNVQDKIKENKRDILLSETRNQYIKKSYKILSDILINIDSYIKTTIDGWSIGKQTYDSEIHTVVYRIGDKYKNQFYDINKVLDRLNSEKFNIEKRLNEILKLDDYEPGNQTLKIIPFEKISSNEFQYVKAVSKVSGNLFPEIITFKSELAFISYQNKKNDYTFIVDRAQDINWYKQKIEEIRFSIKKITESLSGLKKAISDELFLAIKDGVAKEEKELEEMNIMLKNLNNQHDALLEKEEEINNQRVEEIETTKKVIERERNEEKYRIMREKKGQYTYYWKHRRKSWDEAFQPIFFDVGKDYLFEKTRNGKFKKMMITDFLNIHLNKIISN